MLPHLQLFLLLKPQDRGGDEMTIGFIGLGSLLSNHGSRDTPLSLGSNHLRLIVPWPSQTSQAPVPLTKIARGRSREHGGHIVKPRSCPPPSWTCGPGHSVDGDVVNVLLLP